MSYLSCNLTFNTITADASVTANIVTAMTGERRQSFLIPDDIQQIRKVHKSILIIKDIDVQVFIFYYDTS